MSGKTIITNQKEYKEAKLELLPLINEHLPLSIKSRHGLSNAQIIQSLLQEKHSFGITNSMSEQFMSELPYLKLYGMTAFNSGYCWKGTCLPMLRKWLGDICHKYVKVVHTPLFYSESMPMENIALMFIANSFGLVSFNDGYNTFKDIAQRKIPGLKDLFNTPESYNSFTQDFREIFNTNWHNEFNHGW